MAMNQFGARGVPQHILAPQVQATSNPNIGNIGNANVSEYLSNALEIARIELTLAQQKVQAIESMIMHKTGAAVPPPGFMAQFSPNFAQQAQALAQAQAAQAQAAQAKATEAIAESAEQKEEPVKLKKKRRKLVQYDEDGKVIKKAMSGYNIYMAESMKPGENGEKPNFNDLASSWKNLTEEEKNVFNEKAKKMQPKVAREEWIEIDVDDNNEPKKRKKREKSGYNIYVSAQMKQPATDEDGNRKSLSMQELSNLWKNLPDDEKTDWNEKAKKIAEEEHAKAEEKEEMKQKEKEEKAEAKKNAAEAKKEEKKKEATEAKQNVAPTKKTPKKPPVDIVKVIQEEYVGKRIAAWVKGDEEDPNDEDIWLPGKILSVERDEEDNSVAIKVKTVDRQTGEVEFPATLSKFPTEDCRLISEDDEGVVYLHDPNDYKKKVEFYRPNPDSLKKGDLCFGNPTKSGDSWYSGKVAKVTTKGKTQSCLIEFDDGDSKTFTQTKDGYTKVWLVNKDIHKVKPKKVSL